MNIDGLGERLKMYREKRGLTKDEVMEQLGFSRSSINIYESGRGLPDALNTVRMAQLYGVSLRELLGDPEPEGLFPPGEIRFTCAPILRKREAEHKSWTQLDIACRYAPKNRALYRLTHVKNRIPHIDTLIWVSEHLNIPIEDFFEY